ncbi:aldose 1-epimerase family protein [Microbacterium sp. 1P10UB]|uniref:aldose 1-epimerase family protein n=1 Tax=unclassified Microbacterium TaxID=2609290 RepID=UPI0039A30A72
MERAGYRASVASVGASVRALTFDGRSLVADYPADTMRPAMRGAVLLPWPNRIADARYVFSGETHELTMNEPATRTASHGLVAWQEFTVAARTTSSVVLHAVLAPQPGYPWRLSVEVAYVLEEDGLHQSLTVTNESVSSAPVGLGAHPYLVAGPPVDDAVADWTLTLPADDVLLTDDRFLPTRLVPVAVAAGGAYDFREGRRLHSTAVNHAFTGLRRSADGLACARLLSDDGTGVELAWDGDWVQVYTADEPSGGVRRHAVAVEPMTCPPDAFTSRVGLRVVEPGAATTMRWVLRALG